MNIYNEIIKKHNSKAVFKLYAKSKYNKSELIKNE